MGARTRGLVVPMVAIAALVIAAFHATWWRLDEDAVEVLVGLRGATACALDACVPFDLAGPWVVIGAITWALALGTALVLGIGAVQLAMGSDARVWFVLGRRLGLGTLIATIAAAVDALTMNGGTPSIGPILGLIGGLGALAAAVPVHDDTAAVGTPAQVAAAPRTPVRVAGGVGTDAAHGALRFVAASATLTATGLRVELAHTSRELAWADVTRVAVHRLPPDPPYDKAAFLDLVTAAGPVRITAASRVDYAALPGGAAPNTKENWRRLVAHARTIHPGLAIEAEAAGFFAGGEAPMFAAWKQFVAYDRQYG